jgi:ankyrin repeat protein
MDIHECCIGGDLVELQRLLAIPINVNEKDILGNTPLHYASINGHLELVLALLNAGSNIDVQNNYGWTSLHFASAHGHVNIIKELINHGADLNKKNNFGSSLWNSASVKSFCLTKLTELLEDNFNDRNQYGPILVDTRDDRGLTPLHYAILYRHAESVAELIKHGANVNLKNDYGSTPLHMASKIGHLEIVEILLGYSDRYITDLKGNTALECAMSQEIRDAFTNYGVPNVKEPEYN